MGLITPARGGPESIAKEPIFRPLWARSRYAWNVYPMRRLRRHSKKTWRLPCGLYSPNLWPETLSHHLHNHRSTDIPQMPSKFVEIVPLSHRQGSCIPFAAIRWHDFGNRPALGRPLGHFSRHPDTLLLSLSPRRRFPRPTPERVFAADHQSSSGFSGIGPSAPPPQPIGT